MASRKATKGKGKAPNGTGKAPKVYGCVEDTLVGPFITEAVARAHFAEVDPTSVVFAVFMDEAAAKVHKLWSTVITPAEDLALTAQTPEGGPEANFAPTPPKGKGKARNVKVTEAYGHLDTNTGGSFDLCGDYFVRSFPAKGGPSFPIKDLGYHLEGLTVTSIGAEDIGEEAHVVINDHVCGTPNQVNTQFGLEPTPLPYWQIYSCTKASEGGQSQKDTIRQLKEHFGVTPFKVRPAYTPYVGQYGIEVWAMPAVHEQINEFLFA